MDDRQYELKPLVAVQWVRFPPGKGQPASRKRALHVCGNATREAYGSRCRSCVLAPKSDFAEAFAVQPEGGSIDVTDMARERWFDRGPGAEQRHGKDRLKT